MKNQPLNPLTMVQVDVSLDDIEAMKDRFDADRRDISTANAISVALRKRLKTKAPPKIVFASNHNACQLKIGEQTYPLPQRLYWWLRDFQMTTEVDPERFSFAIPVGWLSKEA